jgi:hypothetical protein
VGKIRVAVYVLPLLERFKNVQFAKEVPVGTERLLAVIEQPVFVP